MMPSGVQTSARAQQDVELRGLEMAGCMRSRCSSNRLLGIVGRSGHQMQMS
jgi:hypothetical protein